MLIVKNLNKSFGPFKAVSNFNLTIGREEFICLVGPDGAGKSTALRMLAGLEKPDSGEIELFGKKVVAFTSGLRTRIGYLPQNFSLYGDLTVEENLKFFAGLYGQHSPEELIKSLLEFTRLGPFKDRQADQLSGGMKQKLSLACTLVHQPELILLDEPTTGVDPVSRRDFWQILFSLQREGKSILMTTPYLDEAERATRVALMNQGQLLAFDTPEKLIASLPGKVLELVSPESRVIYQHLKTDRAFLDVQLRGDRVDFLVSKEYQEEILKKSLVDKNLSWEDLAEISPSLENVFIYLLKKENPGRENGDINGIGSHS
ncbi:MAG: ABC transporter ATP-binding protein [Candidatus Saccharicenans sp.]